MANPSKQTVMIRQFDAGDYYMDLADPKAYIETRERVGRLYTDQGAWSHKAILNVAASGKFSGDRTIAKYAGDIRHVQPCPVPWGRAWYRPVDSTGQCLTG
jgi:glucan phosphorylase